MTIPELARREELSEPHVAKLLMILRKGGFINSTRGASGGYTLSRPPQEIVLKDLLSELGGRLFDEEFCDRHSGLAESCPHEGPNCSLHHLWSDVQEAIDSVLAHRTLHDVMVPSAVVPIASLRNGVSNGKFAADRLHTQVQAETAH